MNKQILELAKEAELYYIQRKPSGFLGNSPFWWAKGGNGYTAYIQGAERFIAELEERIKSAEADKARLLEALKHCISQPKDGMYLFSVNKFYVEKLIAEMSGK